MPRTLTIAASQSHTLSTTSATLSALRETTSTAASAGVDILLFPEAYLGGYPRTCTFGTSIGARDDQGKEQFLQHFHSAVDFGDTPLGAGDKWVSRDLEVAEGKEYRGDGTREQLEAIARDTGLFLVVGAVERAGGSLYCSCVYVCPQRGCLGKRRKVMPTGMERVVWAQGQPETLKAVVADVRGVKVCLAAAICWESYMPLLRMGLYCQNVELYLAPTADGRDTWLALMRTVACEGRCFVVSANQCLRRRDLPSWITGVEATSTASQGDNIGWKLDSMQRRKSIRRKTEEGHEIILPNPSLTKNVELDQALHESTMNETLTSRFNPDSTQEVQLTNRKWQNGNLQEDLVNNPPLANHKTTKPSNATHHDQDDRFMSRGGSCIIGPTGDVLAGPLWEVEKGGLLIATVDFEDCERGRLEMDLAGSYGRLDSFELKIRGLDLNPPP